MHGKFGFAKTSNELLEFHINSKLSCHVILGVLATQGWVEPELTTERPITVCFAVLRGLTKCAQLRSAIPPFTVNVTQTPSFLI
ncbi:hypothetical protein PhaeoP75_02841 [Phaeobacter gallaeciensis]|uniref:Uncharacterized protein n=1 Tax=Phaeobacter gallaeciensis TaxID=60890 RepID=A0AAD0EC96_9RHOB|nr:hypothetical protein Gal_02802 [Phaeobacter gallaeciensis DSM 26640]ATE93798.1 hypothetical protein PhaeoP11_02792 [Phaeobacter gallaeciensis]ATE96381.1 hypothetical protein PhaeoP73_01055 [Phaeobacter gallaeciensis]ATF02462.1 hypothetical protein PhaeoP75_02841 [Phaeobacter gallaeciensis]ATF06842.1 hypothetical protein PhaeoP63_02790 [Phaeobacter gallaeciensis]